jgi:hypothetical protein
VVDADDLSDLEEPDQLERRLATGRSPADLLGQHDDDALRAANVAEPATVLGALHLAEEFGAACVRYRRGRGAPGGLTQVNQDGKSDATRLDGG